MIKEYLKKYKITKKAFAAYVGYTQHGVAKALNNPKMSKALYPALLKMILEKRGFNLEKLLDSVTHNPKS